MIYLRFAIAPLQSKTEDDARERTVEFMFQSEDVRVATRVAVTELREQGWKALEISDAWEGYAIEEFEAENRPAELFRQAELQGVAYRFVNEASSDETYQLNLALAG
jgi:hypothetical protein